MSGVLATGFGAGAAQAQTTAPAEPAPVRAPVQVEEQTTPYESAQPLAAETPTAPPVRINVQAPAPVVVETAAPSPLVPQSVIVEEHPVHVTIASPRRFRRDMAVSLGGGVGDFTDASLRDRTGVNGAYEARVGFGMNSLVALEAAYVGTVGEIDTLGLDDNALLISNGVEGLARLNLGTFDVQPYVVAGVSWVRYNIVNESFNTSDVRDSDSVLAIPVGGGVSTYIPDTPLMLDARFTYRATFDDELVRPTPGNSDGASMNNWLATLRLGYTF